LLKTEERAVLYAWLGSHLFAPNRNTGFNFCDFVLQGMLSSRGSLLLFADADGATKIPDLAKLEDALKKDSPTDVIVLDSNTCSLLWITSSCL
jgi:hypothetical protein